LYTIHPDNIVATFAREVTKTEATNVETDATMMNAQTATKEKLKSSKKNSNFKCNSNLI